MSTGWQVSRRNVLRGLGTAIALPWLESISPALSLADEASRKRPVRMAFIYVPNGMNMADWTPLADGAEYEVPYILEPLAAHRKELLVLTGLAQDAGRAHGDGGGDHARSLSSFLTGVHPRKTAGADIKVGISVDQLAAEKIGRATRLISLELGCDSGPNTGNCDSGYSCAYSANISWRSESTPAAKEMNPRVVFERLFSDGEGTPRERARRLKNRKSILDFVLEDADQLERQLGAKDRRKMDEYLSGVREVEQRLAQAENAHTVEAPKGAKPSGIPRDFTQHVRLMMDLMALAFQADLTRVCTFVVASEGSNRSYPFVEVPEAHHDLSHHGGDPTKMTKIAKINRFHATQFAYLLEKLRGVEEEGDSLLDNSMILYGSGISDGNEHAHDNLPILLAGRAGGSIRAGRHVRFAPETPLNNLYLSMLDRVEAHPDALGDSTGRLDLAG